jgi:hypothetical protein
MGSRWIAIIVAAACLGGAVATPQALADEATPDTAGGRYLFQKQADGFVRLDTQTGAVSLCNQQPVGWACEVAPEDRAVLENEIDRLRAENAALKKDILARGLPLPPGIVPPVADSGAPESLAPKLALPSDGDIDHMISVVGRVWHRFVEAIERAQKQILNKG